MKPLTKAQLKKFLTEPDGMLELSSKKTVQRYAPSNIVDFFKDLKEHRKTLLAIVKAYPLFTISQLLDVSPSKNTQQSQFILEILATYPQWEAPLREHATDAQIKVLDRLTTFEHAVETADSTQLPDCITLPVWQREQKTLAILDIEPVKTAPRFEWERKTFHIPLEKPDLYTHFSNYNAETDSWDDAKELRVVRSFRKFAEVHIAEKDRNIENNIAPNNDGDTLEKNDIDNWSIEAKALWLLGVSADKVHTVLETGEASPDYFCHRGYIYLVESAFYHLPKPLIVSLIDAMPVDILREKLNGSWEVAQLLHWMQAPFLPVLTKALSNKFSKDAAGVLAKVGWYGVAPYVAMGLKSRWIHKEAADWLTHYAEQAVHGLLPVAFSADAPKKKACQMALHLLAQIPDTKGILTAEIKHYSAEIQQAVQTLIDHPLIDDLPDKLPSLPKNLYLPSLPQLILQDSARAVATTDLPTVLQILSLSSIEAETTALAELKSAITKQSLAAFSLKLLLWYDSQDRPSKYRWMFNIQGHVGNDATALELAKFCKRFRSNLNRVGAYDALTMLTQIGSDTALMLINNFAEQKRYGDIQERAMHALDVIANNRGLSREDLADRTVPDLGLDASGNMVLSYGPRSFTIMFDEQLQPVLRDGCPETGLGKIRKTLPKPNQKDDEALANDAKQRLKDLKKQLKSVAKTQIQRLEHAMCRQRLWCYDDFYRFFVAHPLLRNLSQRLAWAMYRTEDSAINPTCSAEKTWVGLCRVTEEMTLTDSQDDDLSPDDIKDYYFGVAHRINIPDTEASTFGDILQDYEIIQPFDQLNRQLFVLPSDGNTTEHTLKHELKPWESRKVTMASVRGLMDRGWEREVGDGGMIYCFEKHFGTFTATFILDEGWYVYDPVGNDTEFSIAGVDVLFVNKEMAQAAFTDTKQKIAYSEMQRDLHMLAWF